MHSKSSLTLGHDLAAFALQYDAATVRQPSHSPTHKAAYKRISVNNPEVDGPLALG
jgi:hypothetical protein